MSNLLKKDKGFTLIEIVLVLAIAGLLLVIVFLAVQGAQRSRRDTQRKEDAGRMLAAVESCAANNNGLYTTCQSTAQLITSPNTYFAPATAVGGGTYSVGTGTATTTQFQIPSTCTGTGTISVAIGQEAGAPYCIHN